MKVTTLNQSQVRSIVLEAKLTKGSRFVIDAKSAGVLYRMLLDGVYDLDKHAKPFRTCLLANLRDRAASKLSMTAETILTAYVRCEDCQKALYRSVEGPHVKGTLLECVCGTRWRPRSLRAGMTTSG